MFLALALCLNFCGCGCFDRSWAIKCGDESLPTGVYVFFLMQAHQEAIQKLSQDGSTTDDITNATIEGQSAPNWIVEKSLSMCKDALVGEAMFSEMGLSLAESDEKQIQELVDSVMSSSGTMFANSGISRRAARGFGSGEEEQDFYGDLRQGRLQPGFRRGYQQIL